eukprot:TRINITY_DN95473_c0_g1_i1.p1 TRINITY_DN95473_c0_g1~~TRINITY_DN95473_c0_g1_i1.p1  ORF type:complete len:191 (-),score=36.66 TRINITY_DN95473_c0_g1_i1:76-648(-)
MADRSPPLDLPRGPEVRFPPIPTHMDDWSKLDYYRFVLFQRQVQEEFLRENMKLRSCLGTEHDAGVPLAPQDEFASWPFSLGIAESHVPTEARKRTSEEQPLPSATEVEEDLRPATATALAAEAQRCRDAYEAARAAEERAWAAAEEAWATEAYESEVRQSRAGGGTGRSGHGRKEAVGSPSKRRRAGRK